MCGVYIRVFMIAREQVQRINTLVRATVRMFHENSKDPRFASDSKATVTLASVVMAFAICWIPYFVLFTIRPFLNHPIDLHLDLFTLWLGYVNSMLNPFLYAFHSSQFRKGFLQVLTRRPHEFTKKDYMWAWHNAWQMLNQMRSKWWILHYQDLSTNVWFPRFVCKCALEQAATMTPGLTIWVSNSSFHWHSSTKYWFSSLLWI